MGHVVRPCLREVPNVKKNFDEFHARGFEVIAISIDEDREALEKFLKREPRPWIELHDGGLDDTPVARQYGVTGPSTAILVDRDGKVASIHARGPELGKLLATLFGPPKADN